MSQGARTNSSSLRAKITNQLHTLEAGDRRDPPAHRAKGISHSKLPRLRVSASGRANNTRQRTANDVLARKRMKSIERAKDFAGLNISLFFRFVLLVQSI